MTQDSVLKLLAKVKKPISIKEINEKLKMTSAQSNLKKLKDHGEVKVIYKGRYGVAYYFV